jgi:hypothetical protein
MQGHPLAAKLLNTATAVVHAIKDHDCEALGNLSVHKSISPARCQRILAEAPNPRVGRFATYGSGAVVQLNLANGRQAAAVFVLGGGPQWRFAFAIPTLRSIVGTHADLTRGRAMLSSVLHAIAAGDCATVARDFPKQMKTAGSPADCFGLAGTHLQVGLRHGFKGPRAMGGNIRVEFYLALLNGPHPYTFVVLTQNRKPRFAAAYENPPLNLFIRGKLAPQ